ncbi:MAG: peptide chain release factor N(5)-glutamine methyltransferase [Candidatus Margulisiibacteriota bacterium]
METWTIKKLLDWTTTYFTKHQVEWPHLEAEILLAHALNFKRIDLYVQHEKVLSSEELARFKGFVERRLQHEPIAYITGFQPFMGLDFIVTRDTLIPRPETEKLVETAIDFFSTPNSPLPTPYLIADIGTGSGAIAISLAKFLPQVKVFGIDISAAALEVAQQNANKHNVADRCQFIQGNLLDPLIHRDKVTIDLIISNPPYIPAKDIPTLMADVKDFEPHGALDGGEDGLDYIRQLIDLSANRLTANGLLLFEFGFGQANEIVKYAQNKYAKIKIIKDNTGIERIFKGNKTI